MPFFSHIYFAAIFRKRGEHFPEILSHAGQQYNAIVRGCNAAHVLQFWGPLRPPQCARPGRAQWPPELSSSTLRGQCSGRNATRLGISKPCILSPGLSSQPLTVFSLELSHHYPQPGQNYFFTCPGWNYRWKNSSIPTLRNSLQLQRKWNLLLKMWCW